MAGQNIARLTASVTGMDKDDVDVSRDAWGKGAVSLASVAKALDNAAVEVTAGFGPDSAIGGAAKRALNHMKTATVEPRRVDMKDAKTALDDVYTQMVATEGLHKEMPTAAPGAAPKPPTGAGETADEITALKIYANQTAAHNRQVSAYGDADEKARQQVEQLNTTYDDAAKVMARIHGEPVTEGPFDPISTGGGGGGQSSAPPTTGSPTPITGTPTTFYPPTTTNPPGTDGNDPTGTDDGTDDGTDIGTDDGIDPGTDNPWNPGGDDSSSDPDTPTGNDTAISPTGSGAGGGGGIPVGTALGVAGAGVLGGLGIRGAAGAIGGLVGRGASAGVLGASGRASASGVLGRGGGAVGGQAVGRGGAAGGGARSAGGGAGGARGGRGTGGRGAGGRGAGGAGAGGAGSRGKKDKKDGRESDYEVEEDWTDDEGSPSVLS